MKTIFFLLKRFYFFLKIDIFLFKSINKAKIALFILLSFIFWKYSLSFNNEDIKQTMIATQNALYWGFFVFIFNEFKKQNLFYHLIINRNIFYILPELLIFLSSIYVFFFLVNTIIAILTNNNNNIDIIMNFTIISTSLMIDAFLFIVCKIWKYTLFQLLIVTSLFIYLVLICDVNLIKMLSVEASMPKSIIPIIGTIKIILSINEIKRKPECLKK